MENISLIKKYLKISSIFSILISVYNLILLGMLPLISVLFDKFIDYLKENDQAEFAEMVSSLGDTGLVFIYVLLGLLIVPFLIESIVITIKSLKNAKRINKIDRNEYISLSKDALIFIAFGIASVVGLIITYSTLKIHKFVILLIPLIITIILYGLGSFFKIKSLKYTEMEYKKQ